MMETKTTKTLSMISILDRITVCCRGYLIENKFSSSIPAIQLGISCLEIKERKTPLTLKNNIKMKKLKFR